MRKKIKDARILKINKIDKSEISVSFNNGEIRIIDFKKLLSALNIGPESPAFILNSPKELNKVQLQNNTLSFSNVEQFITLKNGNKEKVPFEIGADTLLEHSSPSDSDLLTKLGSLIKEARKRAGLTQEELAVKSGTSRTYISRIENDHSDIEIATLKKIIEIGLGRKLQIQIK